MKNMRPMGRLWHLYKMGGITPAIASVFDAQTAQQMAFIRSVMKEQRKNELFDMPLRQLETVIFDLETTGFSPYNGDEIISIGAVKMEGAQLPEAERETFYSLINPKRDVPKTVEKLTGITNEMVRESPDLIAVLHDFLEYISRRVLVCHGSGHDKHFLNSALWRTCKVNLSHRLLDCMIIAKWLDPKGGPYDLDTLLHKYEVPVTTRHHALEDAVMTGQLWGRMIDDIEAREVRTLGELYEKLSYL